MARRFAVVPLLMIALMVPAAGAQEDAPSDADETVRWKFAEGDSYQYRLVQTTKNSTVVEGQTVETTISQTVGMTWEVDSAAEDGEARVAQTIDRIEIDLTSQFADIHYDTDAEEAPEGPAATIAPLIDAMVGARVVLVMTPLGEVVDVEVPPEMVEALRNAGPAAQAIQGLASADGIKALIGQSTLVLDQSMPIGEDRTWERPIELPTPQGTMALTNIYTYNGAEGEGPTRTIDAEIRIERFTPAPGAPFQLDVKEQDGRGSYTFNVEAGRLETSKVTQDLSVVVKVQEQEITSESETVASLTLVE